MILAGMLLIYSTQQLIVEGESTKIKHYQTWESGPTSQTSVSYDAARPRKCIRRNFAVCFNIIVLFFTALTFS